MNMDSKQIHLKVLLILLPWASKWRLLLSWWSRNEIDFSFRVKLKSYCCRESSSLIPLMRWGFLLHEKCSIFSFSGKALLGHLCSKGEWEKNSMFTCLLAHWGGDELILYIRWGYGCVQGLGQRGSLGVLPTPL